jgi:hypothetical protein
MDEILKTAVEEAAPLRKQDILVLWAGANDIEALRNLRNFMEGHMKTNIILIHAQHRHDLINTSCVNKEVDKFNWKLKKIIKIFPIVTIMEVETQRQHFTRHGQHLNLLGKELVAIELAKNIR